ncbi:MAG: polyphosphate polymerase domain-containing protein [Calditrichaeota bacterium]|nr:MAG: VTC domain-containing protein [Calditrichota bacterium]MBL1204720.1 polyphosphate polymerase domain-containing protein [Calditrichota bacterium]NOG44548.1 polyphosphate polymerase domain-containing protein [Calditrichota bacterium]
MLKREIKYLLPLEMLPKVRDFLSPYMRLDKFAGPKEAPDYTVRSVYYDTRSLKYYHEKIDGLQNRIKVRIRSYNTYTKNSVTFLELKRKNGSHIFKNRYPLIFDQLDDVFSGKKIESNLKLKSRDRDRELFLYHIFSQSLNPVILVAYEREAYHYKFNPDLRITFDKDIRSIQTDKYSNLFETDNFINTFRNKFVLEMKFNKQFPGWLISMIKSMHLQARSVSKYTLSIDKQLEMVTGVKQLMTIPRIQKYSLKRVLSRTESDVR